jgi:hypothetical protein
MCNVQSKQAHLAVRFEELFTHSDLNVADKIAREDNVNNAVPGEMTSREA